MCIFSQDVSHVSKTRVYARLVGMHQYLVYEMQLASATDLAMILPLPTKSAHEDQLEFIDLSGYPRFFDDIDRCFPKPISRSRNLGAAAAGGASLAVHRVGAFDASFVPALEAFPRLDARFRLPDDLWSDLPYGDFGFAVFQLRAGDSRIHPMALAFSTRDPKALFFPTAHVHDGTVHPAAQFDHSLYAQGGLDSPDWVRGSVLPREVMDFGNLLVAERTKGIVEPQVAVVRRELRGLFPNQDTWLPISGTG